MVKILVLQFRKNPEFIAREQNCLRRELGTGMEIDFIDVLEKELNWNSPETIIFGYQGVILGGSGDLDFDGNRPPDDDARLASRELLKKLTPFFQYLFDYDIPTLGICYGHQILGAFAGVKVCFDAGQRKTCSHEVRLMVDRSKSALVSNLPDKFHAHYGHKDVLEKVPEGAVLLFSGGEKCQVSALQYKNNIFTFQFHPELSHIDIKNRAASSPDYLPAGVSVDEIFIDDNRSNMIIRNFSWLVESTLSKR